MKKIIFLIVLIILIQSCQNKQRYENEDLLFRYIDGFQKEKIHDAEYNLITLRSKNICASCYSLSLDTLLKTIIDTNSIIPLYVLFDEEMMFIKSKIIYGNKVNCLYSGDVDLDEYGIEKAYPYRFYIYKSKIINWGKIHR